jgi:hypothetical protein
MKANTYHKSYFGRTIIRKVGLRVKKKWVPMGRGEFER